MSAAAAVVALPVAALTIWALLRTGLGQRIVARPSGDRWHEHDTPTFGGIGIFLGLVAGIGACLATGAVEPSTELAGIAGGAAIVFAFGLVDDLRSLPAAAKLAAQIGAAAVVIAAGLRVEIVDNPVAATALGLLWLVGITNAFNLLDNMDGLAGSLAIVSAVFFAIDAVSIHSDDLLLVVSLALALAVAGFLPYNFRPRRPAAVFMGDSGSQVVGLTLASLGLATSWKVAETTVATLILPLLVLAIPILDTALVTAVRLVEGRPVHQGGRDHASHRLVRSGISEKATVLLLCAIAAGLGLTSLAYSGLDNGWVTLVGVLVTFALLIQLAGWVTDIDEGEERPGTEPVRLSRILLRPRRLVEIAVDFALVTAAFTASYLLFVHGSGTDYEKHIFVVSLPVILAASYLVFIPAGLYAGVWRYAGAREGAAVVLAVAVANVLAYGAIWFTSRPFGDFPQRIYVLNALLAMVLIGASRFAERALFRAHSTFIDRRDRRRTLIVGAGRSGRSLLRELRETPGELVVGFVDDDRRLRGRRMQGVPVLGVLGDVERVLATVRPDLVLVTIPRAPRERLNEVVQACERAQVPCRFVRREIDVDPLVAMGAAAE
jgi:UDP-GlcNAc:undecaprenyl-phosphate/decaprenyl-phosphate GlcNAc-1-phosphate transferase